MLRRPTKLILLLVCLTLTGVVTYYAAQLRMQTAPSITLTRAELLPTSDAESDHLKVDYRIENTSIFPVRLYCVTLLVPSGNVIRDDPPGAIPLRGNPGDLPFPATGLSLNPHEVHEGSRIVHHQKGQSGMEAHFSVVWVPEAQEQLMPLQEWLIRLERKLTKTDPADPFVTQAKCDILEPRYWGTGLMHIEFVRSEAAASSP